MASFPPRRFCEIISVVHKHAFRWKWRYLGNDGHVDECAEEYEIFFDCVAAARSSGYEPRSFWTGPVMLAFRPR